MAIDKSGEFWIGTAASDLDEYLRELSTNGYPIDRIVHAVCSCNANHFRLDVMQDEGCARRACVRCQSSHFICDSDEFWNDLDSEPVICPCGSTSFQIAVGFAHGEDRSIRWLTVSERCVVCGMLGAAVDWKIDYAPSDHLYAAV